MHVAVGGTQGTRTVSSVTIGGITATPNVSFQAHVSTAAIYTANVPSGTTADIVATWSGGQQRCGIFWWVSTGLSSDTAVGSDAVVNDTGLSTIDLNVDVATVDGGFDNGGYGSVDDEPWLGWTTQIDQAGGDNWTGTAQWGEHDGEADIDEQPQGDDEREADPAELGIADADALAVCYPAGWWQGTATDRQVVPQPEAPPVNLPPWQV